MANIWRRQPSNRLFSGSLIKHKSSENVAIANTFWEYSGGGTMHYLNLSDSISLLDEIVKQPQLPKSDLIFLGDSVTKLPQVEKSDAISLTDGIAKVISLNKNDLIALSDIITKDISLNKQDSVSLIDSISKTPGINSSDTITLTDALTKNISLSKADIINLTDGIIKYVLSSFSDTVSLFDDLSKNISIIESDTILLSDLIIITHDPHPLAPTPASVPIYYGGGGRVVPREYERTRGKKRAQSPYSPLCLSRFDDEVGFDREPVIEAGSPRSVMVDGIEVIIDSLTMLQDVDWRKIIMAVKLYKMIKKGGL